MSDLQVTSVVCNHCGAPLDVPSTTRFITCAYCGFKLEVHRTPSTIYTEVLESIEQRTQQIADDVGAIRRQNDLEALDRQWMMQRQGYMISDKRGNVSQPSAAGSLFGAGIGAVFGIFWIGLAASSGAPPFMQLFGVVFVVAAIVMGIRGAIRASEYRDAERTYQQRRNDLARNDKPPGQA